MSWVGRFGQRPHSLVTQETLFEIVKLAVSAGLECTLCEGTTAGVLHCNDCGWTRRLCDQHRPKTAEAEHVKKLHAAICEPVAGST